MFRPLLGVLLAATLSAAPPLEQRLMSIIDAHPLIARASWGMYAVEAATGKPRLKTSVTFQTSTQNYCWTTDRGRSRLIKH